MSNAMFTISSVIKVSAILTSSPHFPLLDERRILSLYAFLRIPVIVESLRARLVALQFPNIAIGLTEIAISHLC